MDLFHVGIDTIQFLAKNTFLTSLSHEEQKAMRTATMTQKQQPSSSLEVSRYSIYSTSTTMARNIDNRISPLYFPSMSANIGRMRMKPGANWRDP